MLLLVTNISAFSEKIKKEAVEKCSTTGFNGASIKGTVDRWIDGFTERELDLTLWKPYPTSLFCTIYTITAVGYGDICPKIYSETCVAIFMVIILGIAWATMLGQVCDIVADTGERESELCLAMDGFNAMMTSCYH
jgi:hypothetical protein